METTRVCICSSKYEADSTDLFLYVNQIAEEITAGRNNGSVIKYSFLHNRLENSV